MREARGQLRKGDMNCRRLSLDDLLLEDVAHIKFDVVPFQYRHELFLKGLLTVVFGLIGDVISDGKDFRFAHGKRGVARLPLEFSRHVWPLVDPL